MISIKGKSKLTITGNTGNVQAVKVAADKPVEEYQSMSKAHFLVIVSKDAVARAHGAKINDWPPHNYWAMVSSVKSTIRDDQVLDLMTQYSLTKLSDYSP